jgi:hypothetical protein
MLVEAIIVDDGGTESSAIRDGMTLVPVVRSVRTLPAIRQREVDAYRQHQVLPAGLHTPAYPHRLLDSEIRCILACRSAWRAVIELSLDAGLVVLRAAPAQGPGLEEALDAAIAALRARDLVALAPRSGQRCATACVGASAIVEEHRPHAGLGLHLVGREAAGLLLAATDAVDRPIERLLGMPWIHGVRELHACSSRDGAASAERSASAARRSTFAGIRGAIARARLVAYESSVQRIRSAWQRSRAADCPACSVAAVRRCIANRVIAPRPARSPSTRQRLKGALADLVRRRQPAAAFPLPTAVLAGAMRSGTTSLFSWLVQHPQVVGSRRKEVHFFDIDFARGPDWYRRQFPGARDPSLQRLEATPYYMFEPRVPQRMRELIPDARIVCLLRDPVERALSHYRKNRRDGREPLSFSDALSAEDDRLEGEEDRMLADPSYLSRVHQHFSYRRRGYYADQILRWHLHFPKDQVLILDAGELFARPSQTVARVVAFLGLDPWEPPRFPARNATVREDRLPDTERERWTAHFVPHQRRLESLIGWCPSHTAGEL